jgi:hypothetical protein
MGNIKILVDRIDKIIFNNTSIRKEIKILPPNEYNSPKM